MARLLALDVALLLPAPAARAVGRLNARLQAPPAGFAFDATHLPHVTLVQQFVRDADMPVVLPRLGRVATRTPPLALRGTGLQRGRTTTSLSVEGGTALRALHDRLLACLAPHATPPAGGSGVAGDALAGAFVADGEPPRGGDIEWVTRFRTRAAGDRFEPHVTLGVGALDRGAVPPIAFTATELAACHLGRFCSCRRVLGAWRLGDVVPAGTETEP
ncbi:MAG: 2'-5' RNA ligase family protein [Acidobacteria bacterium]|nr:2'-5' RNA ligase family protein [Acidobacteriota bacterium]